MSEANLNYDKYFENILKLLEYKEVHYCLCILEYNGN